MKGLSALLKKELKEQLRTHRIFIVAGVFLVFGLITPIMVKSLPELIKMAGELDFVLPPPTAVQSLGEYTSTIVQLGVLIIVLIAMGAISRERESGTAALVLSKPVSYPAFVTAKFTALGLTTLIGTVLGSLACWGYTCILFDNVPSQAFAAQNALLLPYFALTIAATLLFSSLFRNQLTAGALGLVTIIILTIASSLPWVGRYLPGELVNWGSRLLNSTTQVWDIAVETTPPATAWGAIAVTLVLTISSLYLAWTFLKKKEI